uniref:Uncharacterized protein n=1 Tax=Arundo donax TaxID=35708 RepID=A0A0A9GZ97_ARUDO
MQTYHSHVNMDTKYKRYNSDAGLNYVSDFRRIGSSFSYGKVTFTIIIMICI